MTYSLEIGKKLKKRFEKIKRKDPLQADILKRNS